MPKRVYEDLKVGDVIGKWTIVGDSVRMKDGKLHWLCECSCLKQTKRYVKDDCLKDGSSRSCGCGDNLSMSFYDWCKENNHNDWLELWDCDKNDKQPSSVSCKSTKKFWFKCINGNKNHGSEQHYVCHIVNRGISNLACKQCNSFAQYLLDNYGEDALNTYWDYDKNEKSPWEYSYANAKKVWIKCTETNYHGSYLIGLNKFNDGCRCPYCNKNSGKLHINDSLAMVFPEVLDVWSDKNEKTPYDYPPHKNKKVWLKCKAGIHEDFFQDLNNATMREFRCPECVKKMKESFLEQDVKNYLNDKYTVLTEYDCNICATNPKTNCKMPYDNEILELKLIIEVHGEQHYRVNQFTKLEACKKGISINEVLKEQQWRDEYKAQYALSQGYEFIAIPYWTRKDESYKQMLDDKIKEIVSNKQK